MDIRVHNAVPLSRNGATVADIFFYVELVLGEPNQVLIDNFSLDLSDQGQSVASIAIDDATEWQWMRGGSFRDLVNCEALPKELSRRGDPIRGWLHFQIPTRPDAILNQSLLTLNVNCEHGTCYFEIDSSNLRTDEHVKGMMWKRPKIRETA